MTGTFSITSAVAEGMLGNTGGTLAAQIGSGANLVIYSGTAPANAGASLSGDTVLATLALSSTPFSGYSFNSSGGPDANGAAVATLGTVTSATAAATGTASFWRIVTSGGTAIMQGACGTSGSDLNLNTTAVTAGSTVSLTSGTISLPTGP